MEFEKIILQIKEANKKEPKSFEDKFIKFNEEYGEFCAEVINMKGLSSKPYSKDNLLTEMADTMQCLWSIYFDLEEKAGISIDADFRAKFEEVNQKWLKKISNYSK